MGADGWTLDELVAQVAAVLGDGGPDQPSRRVREVPDRRAVRWYTTIGLLDRPRLQGRTGRYGPRHLMQLVAIKRLQAEGKPLAEIQGALAGASDAALGEIARLPYQPESVTVAAAQRERPDGGRFWTATPTAAEPARRVSGAEPAGIRYAVDLGDGVTLLLSALAPPQPSDLGAVRAAARPLLDTLAERGLIPAALTADQPQEGDSR